MARRRAAMRCDAMRCDAMRAYRAAALLFRSPQREAQKFRRLGEALIVGGKLQRLPLYAQEVHRRQVQATKCSHRQGKWQQRPGEYLRAEFNRADSIDEIARVRTVAGPRAAPRACMRLNTSNSSRRLATNAWAQNASGGGRPSENSRASTTEVSRLINGRSGPHRARARFHQSRRAAGVAVAVPWRELSVE